MQRMTDGALLAWKALVLRSSRSEASCAVPGGSGGGVPGGAGGMPGGPGAGGMPGGPPQN